MRDVLLALFAGHLDCGDSNAGHDTAIALRDVFGCSANMAPLVLDSRLIVRHIAPGADAFIVRRTLICALACLIGRAPAGCAPAFLEPGLFAVLDDALDSQDARIGTSLAIIAASLAGVAVADEGIRGYLATWDGLGIATF